MIGMKMHAIRFPYVCSMISLNDECKCAMQVMLRYHDDDVMTSYVPCFYDPKVGYMMLIQVCVLMYAKNIMLRTMIGMGQSWDHV